MGMQCGFVLSKAKVAIAFSIYDLDGDGAITVRDAVLLAREVDRLSSVSEHKPNRFLEELCEEMRWLYGFVADQTDTGHAQGASIDLWMFSQVRRRPVVSELFLNHLEIL